jgi:hypothetical protein
MVRDYLSQIIDHLAKNQAPSSAQSPPSPVPGCNDCDRDGAYTPATTRCASCEEHLCTAHSNDGYCYFCAQPCGICGYPTYDCHCRAYGLR